MFGLTLGPSRLGLERFVGADASFTCSARDPLEVIDPMRPLKVLVLFPGTTAGAIGEGVDGFPPYDVVLEIEFCAISMLCRGARSGLMRACAR